MKGFLQICIFLLFSLSVSALDAGQVMYVGGTVPGVIAGIVGRLDTTSDTALIFEHAGSTFAIPYADIQSYEYSSEVTHHLGVLPAIAIGLFKMRRHRHFFSISYRDSNNVAQAAVFEVPKHMPRILQAVLQARAPRPCWPRQPCTARN